MGTMFHFIYCFSLFPSIYTYNIYFSITKLPVSLNYILFRWVRSVVFRSNILLLSDKNLYFIHGSVFTMINIALNLLMNWIINVKSWLKLFQLIRFENILFLFNVALCRVVLVNEKKKLTKRGLRLINNHPI